MSLGAIRGAAILNPGPFAFRMEGTFLVFPSVNPRIVLGLQVPSEAVNFSVLTTSCAHVRFRLRVSVPI